MKQIIIILILMCETVFSQKELRWILVSGQTNENAFIADTLVFVNRNNYEFEDSINLKPNFNISNSFGEGNYFTFSFDGYYLTKYSYSWKYTQYGYCKEDKEKTSLTLQLLEPCCQTDDFAKWNKKQEISYSINKLTHDSLVLIKKGLSNIQSAVIYIKDKKSYDQTFIEGLYYYKEPIKLVDNYIITGKDTTYFPEELPLNIKTTYRGAQNNQNFVLTVTRTNLTNLNYNFQLIGKNNKIIDTKSGKVVLYPVFFLAPETEEDLGSNDSYVVREYFEKSDKCWISLRLGIGKDKNGKQRARVNYGCDDNSKQALNLDGCPILLTE